jgi:hypothetical protein
VCPPQAAHLPKAAQAEAQAKAFAKSAAPTRSILERAGKQTERYNTVAPTALVVTRQILLDFTTRDLIHRDIYPKFPNSTIADFRPMNKEWSKGTTANKMFLQWRGAVSS